MLYIWAWEPKKIEQILIVESLPEDISTGAFKDQWPQGRKEVSERLQAAPILDVLGRRCRYAKRFA